MFIVFLFYCLWAKQNKTWTWANHVVTNYRQAYVAAAVCEIF
jgi:hypothetical protein